MNAQTPKSDAGGKPPELAAASEERYRLISSVATDYVFSSAVEPDGTQITIFGETKERRL